MRASCRSRMVFVPAGIVAKLAAVTSFSASPKAPAMVLGPAAGALAPGSAGAAGAAGGIAPAGRRSARIRRSTSRTIAAIWSGVKVGAFIGSGPASGSRNR